MICRHDWRFPGPHLLDDAVCNKCERQGTQWYDGLSGGVTVRRGIPTLDLRVVYPVDRFAHWPVNNPQVAVL